jgi:hypothetical protein
MNRGKASLNLGLGKWGHWRRWNVRQSVHDFRPLVTSSSTEDGPRGQSVRRRGQKRSLSGRGGQRPVRTASRNFLPVKSAASRPRHGVRGCPIPLFQVCPRNYMHEVEHSVIPFPYLAGLDRRGVSFTEFVIGCFKIAYVHDLVSSGY